MMIINLQFTISRIDVSFFALSWLFASHLYVPLLFLSMLLRVNVFSSFPVSLIFLLSLYQVTWAGGLPSCPLHRHEKSSPIFTLGEREQLAFTNGASEIQWNKTMKISIEHNSFLLVRAFGQISCFLCSLPQVNLCFSTLQTKVVFLCNH